MPGLFGLITKMPREWAEPQLMRMLSTLQHEPFYVSGTWIDAASGVYVGWVAQEKSFAADMPLRNESGAASLFFSGEEFPEPDLIPGLKQKGHAIPTNGASYLVHRYEDEPDFPKGLNGRFHGLLSDQSRGTTLLFNDRFGLHRLYYHEAKGAFYFASEAKAILRVRPELRSLDARSFGEFVACGCVLENRTLFSGMHVLPPGSAWVFQDGLLKKKESYFDPREWEEQERLSETEYYGSLREVFASNLGRYFNGHERVGVSLTGGVDTRIIMAWRKAPPNTLPCYTFGSMYRDNEDVKLARRVAEICNQSHQVIVTNDEFLSRFQHYAERSIYLSDACVDLSRSPDLFVNEKARQIAPVRISGTYGSEIMMHAVMFKAETPVAGLFQEDFSKNIDMARQTFAAACRVHPATFAAFRQSPWHHYGILGLEQSQVTVRSPYLDNDLVKTIYRAPSSLGSNAGNRWRLIQEGNAALAEFPTDRGVRGQHNAPSHTFLEFLFKAEYAYDYGMPQWISQVDHLFSPLHLERIWLGRHKVFHFRVWYRDQLANYVREMLLDARSLKRPYLKPGRVEKIVNGHLRGSRNYTTEIHRLLTLELLHRLFLDAV